MSGRFQLLLPSLALAILCPWTSATETKPDSKHDVRRSQQQRGSASDRFPQLIPVDLLQRAQGKLATDHLAQAYNPPSYRPPTPTYRPPTYRPPTYTPPTYRQPTFRPPTYRPPSYPTTPGFPQGTSPHETRYPDTSTFPDTSMPRIPQVKFVKKCTRCGTVVPDSTPIGSPCPSCNAGRSTIPYTVSDGASSSAAPITSRFDSSNRPRRATTDKRVHWNAVLLLGAIVVGMVIVLGSIVLVVFLVTRIGRRERGHELETWQKGVWDRS